MSDSLLRLWPVQNIFGVLAPVTEQERLRSCSVAGVRLSAYYKLCQNPLSVNDILFAMLDVNSEGFVLLISFNEILVINLRGYNPMYQHMQVPERAGDLYGVFCYEFGIHFFLLSFSP